MVYLTRHEFFNAAHRLSNPKWSDEKNQNVFGKCANANWHGHNYELIVTVKGSVNPETGFLMDVKTLSNIKYIDEIILVCKDKSLYNYENVKYAKSGNKA